MVTSMRRYDGNALLYRVLLVLVLCSYSLPIYVVITQITPAPSTVITWMLNLVVLAVLLLTLRPVWRWVQPRVHHLVYAADDPNMDMLGHLSESLASTAPEPSLLVTIAETIARTVKLPYVQIETANGATAAVGTRINGRVRTRIEITYHAVSVGWLEVIGRLPGEPLTVGEYQLLHSLTRQVGIALHAAHLTSELQTSRAQIVLAREEERRRIRRDLHDGLGPTLAALRLQLSALRHTVRQSPDAAEAMIDELRDDVRAATAEIRRLVYDLRPPMLDEFGLVGALRNLEPTSDGLTRSIEAPEPLPPLPAAVEVAIYRIAAEALHNSARHASASHCAISLAVCDATVILNVTDNGCGLPATYFAGVGHRSMHERAAELGGSVSIGPAPAGGTCVRASFPLKEAHDA